jgi:hypothetical protein
VDAAKAQGQATAEWMERTQFRERGLSSDTSIFIDFALDQALTDLRAAGQIAPGGVRRLAIVGPGLDFTDKHDGYDFYPQQTIQPFALMDSLLRLGLANRGAFRLTTFDINARITEHLEGARQRAREGGAYPLALPRNMDAPWNRPLAVYWESLGAGIADRASDLPAPPNAGNVRVRSLRVQPDVVMSILPMTLNIVLERLEGQTAEEQFDLIVATDVLVYYGVFEQSLALTNLAAMLKPGGILLSNTRMFLLPSIAMAEVGTTDVTYMPIPGRGDLRDRVYWYQRR